MTYIRVQDLIDKLSGMGKRVFTIGDASKLTGKPQAYLSRLLPTSSKIRRLERGKYYLDGADIYEIASNVIYPSYVSLFSAFRYYDLTTQEVARISVLSVRRHGPLKVGGTTVEFTSVGRERLFGYARHGNAFIATAEKAIIDSLYLNRPGYHDVRDAFENAKREGLVDIGKMKRYALLMDSGALVSRLGFLLDGEGEEADDLLGRRSARRVEAVRGGKKYSRKWGVYYD